MANETILVVDADTRSRKVLEVGFSKSGYRVLMTETMREALIELEREQPDLVVSDTDLPDGDGFELCKRVKEDPDLGYVPFLFLTDEASLPNKIKGLEIGADDYLTRPIYLREVTTRATVLLQKRTRKLLSESDVEEFEGELSDITLIDLLQTVEAEERTGTIHLEREGRDAVVTFRDGNILDAACGKLQGTDAVYRLMLWPAGSFVVRYHDDVGGQDRIGPDTQDLIVEGIDRLQAWDALVDRLPSLERVFEADYQKLPDLLDEAPDAVGRIARLFDGVRTLRDVIDDSPVDDITTLQVIERLLERDVLRDITPEDQQAEVEGAEQATSHLAEWLESRGSTQAYDELGLESEGAVRPESEVEEAAETASTESAGDGAGGADAVAVEPQQTPSETGGDEDDPAATMEDLEEAEKVRRKVEAQQLRRQQAAPESEQSETDNDRRGVPQIPGATQPGDQPPPPEEQSGTSDEASSDGERDREDTPRAHPASSQDESVEAWLSEGPDVESFEADTASLETESASGPASESTGASESTSSSETRPQFPAVDIGDEVIDSREAERDEAPSPGADSTAEPSAEQPAEEGGTSEVEPSAERREEAISRAESVSQEAHPPERPEQSEAPATDERQRAEGPESTGAEPERDRSDSRPEAPRSENEETPTEAMKTDIRPEDLTDELEPTPVADQAVDEESGQAREGPLDVERVSENGEIVQAEYDLTSQQSTEAASEEAESTDGATSLAEETPVERRHVDDEGAEPSKDEESDASEEEAASTQEMWIDGSGGDPDETPKREDGERADGATDPGLAWGDEPSARPGEGDTQPDEPTPQADEEGAADAQPGAELEADADEADIDEAGVESEAVEDSEAPDTGDGAAPETEPEVSDVPESDATDAGAREQESAETAASKADEETEQAESTEAADESEQAAPETESEAGDEPAAEQTEQVAPPEQHERETVPADEAVETAPAPESDAGSDADEAASEAETEPESTEGERITEDEKEADFFEQGAELRDTTEEDFDWDFEEEESGGARWQYWAIGAAVLALGVLGVMGVTGSGPFGGAPADTEDGSAQAEAVGADDEKSGAAAGDDAMAGAVAEADTGQPDTGAEQEKTGLDKVSGKVVARQEAKDAVSLAKTIAENVEPQQVAQEGGGRGDGSDQAAGGAGGQGGAGGGATSRVEDLMDAQQYNQAYQALREARQASPGSSQVAQLHVQLGSKFQTTGDDEMARKVYQDYLDQWPNGRFAGQLESILENQL